MLNSQENYSAPSITTRQKIAVAFLLVFFLAIVGLSAKNYRNVIADAGDFGKGPQKNLDLIDDQEKLSEIGSEVLKKVDTDQDGLMDWDEVNIYQTSAYLQDTNGDGVNDGDSVKKGINPYCLPGQKCDAPANSQSAIVDVQNSSTTLDANFSQEQLAQMSQVTQLLELRKAAEDTGLALATDTPALVGLDPDGGVADRETAQQLLSGQVSADSLRKMMLDAGVNPTDLQKISDADLLKNYQDLLKKQ